MLNIEKKPAGEENELLFGGFSCVCRIWKLAILRSCRPCSKCRFGGERPAAAAARVFVSFFGTLFENLRQIGRKTGICRNAKSHPSGIYDKAGENDEFVVIFICLGGFGCVPGKPGFVPAAHFPELMHPIYDKKDIVGKIVVNLENGILSLTSNSAQPTDLS